MERFKFIPAKNISKLPETTGIYSFKKGKELFYIGKANNIKKRVNNHFLQPSYKDNLFISKTDSIGYIKTDSEIEALILEARFIKRFQPKFNAMWKDDKNFFYVAIINIKQCPMVFITHRLRKEESIKYQVLSGLNTKYLIHNTNYIGPFTDGKVLKQALKILRKIFPYYTAKKHPNKFCQYCHLGLCPGPKPDMEEYRKNIKNIADFLQGKKKSVIKRLKKEMFESSKSQDFEKAKVLRDKIFSLENIISHAKIIFNDISQDKALFILKKILNLKKNAKRIEGYDISNISGKSATGSMVVFINGTPEKNLYRKFKIKTIKTPNDTAMLKEVLSRRFKHKEWDYPDIILIDGGKAQLNTALKTRALTEYSVSARPSTNSAKSGISASVKNFKVMALAKRNNELYIENKKNPILLKSLPQEVSNLILQIRDESHRFAKSYHKKLRSLLLS